MSSHINTNNSALALSPVLFLLSALIGWLASIKLIAPTTWFELLPFTTLRPLHSLLFISALLFAQFKWANSLVTLNSDTDIARISRWQSSAFTLFMFTALFSVLSGSGSGREYFSWQPWSTIFLLLAQGLHLFNLFKNRQQLIKRSPEAFWLISFGGLFVLIALFESELHHLPMVNDNLVRDLSIQWHAIDGFWAGINASLYGYGAYLISKTAKPLRSKTMYIIAISSLLFTFGHHHYASPQPSYLKSFALFASLVAIISLLRHIKAYKQANWLNLQQTYLTSIICSVEKWTLVATATGILFAIPQFNLMIHGTYLVVIHAMGSVIGINMMLVLAHCFDQCNGYLPVNVKRVELGVKLVNNSLIGLWLVLLGASIIKGTMRTSGDLYQYQAIREYFLIGFPVLGILLLSGITLLCTEAIRVANARKEINDENSLIAGEIQL